MLLLYYCFFCTITLLIYSLTVISSSRRKKVKQRILRFVDGQESSLKSDQLEDSERTLTRIKRWLLLIAMKAKRRFSKRMPGDKVERLELSLLKAGRPFGMTPIDFRLMQIGLFILFSAIAWIYGKLLDPGIGAQMVLIVIGMTTAIVLPAMYLKMKMKKRYALAQRELPDVLDLLTVSLEAGLGFDAALSKLVSKKSGVLALEFQRCLEEIRLGRTRREALVGVRERLDMDEIKSLISSILQAEKLGIGMVQVLRVQSQEVREQRKQRAEEAAMKAPIKMLFPLVLFIFPCLFIILLGPVVIQFLETFGP